MALKRKGHSDGFPFREEEELEGSQWSASQSQIACFASGHGFSRAEIGAKPARL